MAWSTDKAKHDLKNCSDITEVTNEQSTWPSRNRTVIYSSTVLLRGILGKVLCGCVSSQMNSQQSSATYCIANTRHVELHSS